MKQNTPFEKPDRKSFLGLIAQICGDLVAGVKGLMTLVILGMLGVVLIYGGRKEAPSAVRASPPEAEAPVLPAVVSLSFDEATALHGQPVSTDKATGWAVWPHFKARFEAGRCVEVAGL